MVDPPAASRAPRRPRADAERNRQALLDAAREALVDTTDGFSLEAVAKRAGVGIGTLYRHFPTREQLVAAVYDSQVDDLVAQAGSLLEKMPPRQALRNWLDEFVRFAVAKRGMLDALRAESIVAGQDGYLQVRDRIAAAIDPILQAGARDGSLRTDVQAADVVVLVAGALMPAQFDAAQTRRLLGLILDAVSAH